MPLYLIAYDLFKEKTDKDRKAIRKLIKDTKIWFKLSESCYVVDTSLTMNQLYTSFASKLDKNDQFFIIPIKRTKCIANVPKRREAWIQKNLLPLSRTD